MRRAPRPGAKAVITGGGGAIAHEVARRLDGLGYRLVLLDINRAAMEATAAQLGHPAAVEVVNLATPDGIREAAELFEGPHADVDLLVHAAGVVEPGEVIDVDPVEFDRHLNVNLLAPMYLTRAAARQMRTRGRGDIVTIVSMAAIAPLPGSAAYASSKFGLRGFLISARSELARHGIRLMGIYPSGVDTPMLQHEALHGGSALNFLADPLTADQVADGVLSALRTGRLETYLPYHDSLTSRVVLTLPWVAERVLPLFTAVGERGRRKYLKALRQR
ncbi:SDR family NAD(P)-dependent oxidoreductase [Enemella sp. A6]|uniref:SDR family NAD(P)-dependent oxidoreductase n=1 Tax=Enemella sp. A6 TaxID=3440152 RepID=UPI003EBA6A4A